MNQFLILSLFFVLLSFNGQCNDLSVKTKFSVDSIYAERVDLDIDLDITENTSDFDDLSGKFGICHDYSLVQSVGPDSFISPSSFPLIQRYTSKASICSPPTIAKSV